MPIASPQIQKSNRGTGSTYLVRWYNAVGDSANVKEADRYEDDAREDDAA